MLTPRNRRLWLTVLGLGLALTLGTAAWFGLKPQAAQVQPPPTAVARYGPIQEQVAAVGRVVPHFEVEIKAKASGKVLQLPYDVSQRVRQGAMLVQLDPLDEARLVDQSSARMAALQAKSRQASHTLSVASRTLTTDLAKARAAIQSAQARVSETQARRRRLDSLLAEDVISREEYDTGTSAALQAQADLTTAQVRLQELETQALAVQANQQALAAARYEAQASQVDVLNAQRRLSDTVIVSPIDGVVTSRNIQVGAIVSSGISNVGGGTTLMTIADVSRLYVLASVDESDIGRVQTGQTVWVTADAFPNERFRGVVDQVAAKGVNTANVITFEVRIRLLEANALKLKPEMTTNLAIVTRSKPKALLIPADAIRQTRRGAVVSRLVAGADKPSPQPIQTGLSNGELTEVVSGLRPGERVVTGVGLGESRWRKAPGEGRTAARGMGMMGRSLGRRG